MNNNRTIKRKYINPTKEEQALIFKFIRVTDGAEALKKFYSLGQFFNATIIEFEVTR